MGRHLSLACDNCIPGDATGWFVPLLLVALAAMAAGGVAFVLATGRRARWATWLWAAGLACVFGPPMAVGALNYHIVHEDTACGSALSASLLRPRPGYTLDARQSGCRAAGERVVTQALVFGGVTTAVAVAGFTGAALSARPARRRAPA